MQQFLQAVAVPFFHPVAVYPAALVAEPIREAASTSSNSAASNNSDSDDAAEPAIASPGVTCEVCKRVVQNETRLANHMGVHTGTRPHECVTCGQGFASSWDLSQHALSHSKVRPFPCPVCGKSFKRKWEMTRHETIHKQEPRNFQCSECQKFFQTKTTLASHMRIHTDEKPFACQLCDKRFKRKGELTLHNRSHTGERPFQCPHCSRGFRQKGTLTQHLSTHTEDRPFACPHCSVRFRHKSSVMRHLRTHAPTTPSASDDLNPTAALSLIESSTAGPEAGTAHEKPSIQCPTCGQQFKHRSSLSRHHAKHFANSSQQSNTASQRPSRLKPLASHKRATARKGIKSDEIDFTISSAPAFSLDLIDTVDVPDDALVPAPSDLGDDDDDPVTIGRHRLDDDDNDVAVGGGYSLDAAGVDDDDLALVADVLAHAADAPQSPQADMMDYVIDSMQYEEDPTESSETMRLGDDLLPSSADIEDVAADVTDSASDLNIHDPDSESQPDDAPFVLPNGMSLRKRKRTTSAQFDGDSDPSTASSSVNPTFTFDSLEDDVAPSLESENDDFGAAFTPVRMTRSATKRQRCLDPQQEECVELDSFAQSQDNPSDS